MKASVYIIFANKQTYVGCTTWPLGIRRSQHKQKMKSLNTKLYKAMRADSEWKLILIENVQVENFEELLWVERTWMDALQPELNTYKTRRYPEELKEMKRIKDKKYSSKKITCEICNATFSRGRKKKHINTLKHKTKLV